MGQLRLTAPKITRYLTARLTTCKAPLNAAKNRSFLHVFRDQQLYIPIVEPMLLHDTAQQGQRSGPQRSRSRLAEESFVEQVESGVAR